MTKQRNNENKKRQKHDNEDISNQRTTNLNLKEKVRERKLKRPQGWGKNGAAELETVNFIVRRLGTGKQRDKTHYFALAFRYH